MLSGALVRLEPLSEAHIPALKQAGADPHIWDYLPVDRADPGVLEAELKGAIGKRSTGEQYPFGVFNAQSGEALGSTRIFDISPEHRKLEIGWTWYAPRVWGTGVNVECKLLLLHFCFTVLNTVRVQFKTRATNTRSAAAIEKLGAQFEGCLRADRIGADGSVRDTLVYSIIAEEWPSVETHLKTLLAGAYATTG